MDNLVLEQRINRLLDVDSMQDYAPNGLQVEGRREVQRIVTGVTACQALLDAAAAAGADAVLVHHGYFWKSESPTVRGMRRQRLKTLLANDINLYAYHLPLDAHPELGNNAQLAQRLRIDPRGLIAPLLPYGELESPCSAGELTERLERKLHHGVLHCGDSGPTLIRRVAWCSGGGQGFIEQAATFGVDAFISGEVSEQTIHVAREMGIHFFAAGHHATERGGVMALGEWLAREYDLDVTFIDIANPA
ncbi:type 2 GTP cyclohydrolase I [Edwardsiella ictaluri]|uniref:Type 2 GTP cyclohydrolase I n=2 Tax=Edwardsiella ictaluri TaxID=67780 RepID=A0ABY8GHS8_EDWIC|nr:type 2 GTP cyclohydrolase I [Edwardsiella ictaluri]AVZ83044.1 type 2 GTP cyclohydrolase I [Edwardsiella ictaluri]EKS7821461.1 type 2 GTP cyclohydrolase I [Edwardsiella ictaluri]EKS7824852.1 type 2 GTP cyclohydrolase I [Edwardsiella ictaluri]EKS7828223.1 type 2 GTP cyclohydrolase I [Edwardsiella ictaluri]ELV7529008.1 type 2 GTP cyclohydrolase I [Edwardsiella ictaluri]